MLLKQSTARSRAILMIDSADHITGKAGLTLTITASKDAAAFAAITPTVTELANGWYKLALTTAHTDTLGDLALHITSAGADPTDVLDQVVLDLFPTFPANFASLVIDANGRIDVSKVLGSAINALISGRIDSDVEAMSGAIEAAIATAVAQRALTESYASPAVAPTLEQALMMLLQGLTEFVIAGTTITVTQLDRASTAMTFTLNDPTNPSSRSRAS